jgi:prepilin peptidase CpaA
MRESAGASVFLLCILLAATWDLVQRRVPNWLVALTAGLGVVAAVGGATPAGTVLGALQGLVVGLVIWLPLWLIGMLGAGDVKLFAAASAWLGPSLSWRAALLAALFGGVMALVIMARRPGLRDALARAAVQAMHQRDFQPAVSEATALSRSGTLPYAVPMAVGSAVAWFFPDFLRSLV